MSKPAPNLESERLQFLMSIRNSIRFDVEVKEFLPQLPEEFELVGRITISAGSLRLLDKLIRGEA